MSYQYTGYILQRQLPAILDLLKKGQSPRQISEALKILRYEGSVRYIATRYGLLPPPDPNPFPERNLAIIADRKAGMTLDAIAAKYGISRARVAMIVGQEIFREKRKVDLQRIFEETTEFDDLPIELVPTTVRAFNCIRHECKTVGEALKLSDAELLKMPNFGRASLQDWKQAVEQLRREFAERPRVIEGN